VADLVTSGSSRFDLSLFSMGRFGNGDTAQTAPGNDIK